MAGDAKVASPKQQDLVQGKSSLFEHCQGCITSLSTHGLPQLWLRNPKEARERGKAAGDRLGACYGVCNQLTNCWQQLGSSRARGYL